MALPLRSGEAGQGEDDPALVRAQEAIQDVPLVERVLDGDAEAYDELVRRHMRRAFSIAYRILEHREDAEDVVQDAFVRALERLDSLHRGRPFAPWFHRIVVNQSLNHRRKRRVRTTEPLAEELVAGGPDPEQETGQVRLRERLRSALAELPERQRTIVLLSELEGMTSAEIAEVLDVAPGTVRWHLHQAREALRAVLQPLRDEDG